MNTSKGFPGAGITVTFGPVGVVAHPLSTTSAKNMRRPRFQFMLCYLPSFPGWGGVGTTLVHPPGQLATYG